MKPCTLMDPESLKPRAVSTPSRSCALCQKRKVKCDRQIPCSGCRKAGVHCIYRAPHPPRRRKKDADSNVFTLLRKYEELLERNGIDPRSVTERPELDVPQHPLPSFNETRGTTMDGNNTTPATLSGRSEQELQMLGDAKLISKDGKSFYVDNEIWRAVTNELPHAEALLDECQDGDSDYLSEVESYADAFDEIALVFGSNSSGGLAKLHPSPVHIFKLWHIFLENVNPLTKIIHAPTLQKQILEATCDLKSVSKETEALMFGIYSSAVSSMAEEEVQGIFNEPKATLFSKYQHGAKQSLINAGLLKTSDVTVLQAFLLFLVAIRTTCDSRSLWSLSGIAMRIAQRLGLHRDGSQLGLSVFDSEIRRRIWWQLLAVDAIAGQISGSVSPLVPTADTQIPRNLNDSDLHPAMKDPPQEHLGATEMIFCLVRYEIGKWLQGHTRPEHVGFDGHWRQITGNETSFYEKDRLIDQLSNAMEQNILSRLDLSIPLHLYTSLVVQCALDIIRLKAHHPRNYTKQGLPMKQVEKEKLFDLCLKIAEFGNIVYHNKSMQGYVWSVGYHFPWDCLIFILEELRHQPSNEKTEHAWRLVDAIYHHQQQKLQKKINNQFHLAVSNLMLKAWAYTVAEFQRAGRPLPQEPNVISFARKDMERRRTVSQQLGAELTHDPQTSPIEGSTVWLHLERNIDSQPCPNTIPLHTMNITDFEPTGDSPLDWDQWDNLLQQFQDDPSESHVFQPLIDSL